MPPTNPLRPINPDNACIPRITAAAGTDVSRCFFSSYLHSLVTDKRSLRTLVLLPPLGITPSSLRSLRKIPHCCLQIGVWAVSQSQCGRSSSQTGYRSRPWYAVTVPTSESDACFLLGAANECCLSPLGILGIQPIQMVLRSTFYSLVRHSYNSNNNME